MAARYLYRWTPVLTIFPLVPAQTQCPGGTAPLCSLQSGSVCPDGTPPQCPESGNGGVNPPSCPPACDPLRNKCDPTTAPTCIFPDPRVPSPRGACACRPGFKAAVPAWDVGNQWRLPIEGQEHRVWVAEGVGCNVPCVVSSGTGSCQEIQLIAEECVGTVAGVGDMGSPRCQASLPNFPLPMYYGNTSMPVDIEYNTTSSVYMVSLQNSSTVSTFQLSDPSTLGNRTINIPILQPYGKQANNYSNYSAPNGTLDANGEGSKYTLSEVLRQFGVASSAIDTFVGEIAPVFAEIAPAFLQMDDGLNSTNSTLEPEPSPKLDKRWAWKAPRVGGTLGQLGEKFKDAVKTPSAQEVIDKVKAGIADIGLSKAACTVFASGALPGFLAVARAASARTLDPGHTMSHDQMFFLYPVYMDYPIIESLRAHYNFRATNPEAAHFGAITFLRDMYIIAGEAREGPAWNPRHVREKFTETTKTVIHEILHTQQYRSHGWSKESFGYEYLFQWCSNGYHYTQIRYEAEAAAQQSKMDYFLDTNLGYAFFEYWKARNLRPIIGYPTETQASAIPGGGGQWHEVEVQFQDGVLQHMSRGGCTRCFRVLEKHHVIYRQLAMLCANVAAQPVWCPGVQDLWNQKQQEEFECLPTLDRIEYNGFCY